MDDNYQFPSKATLGPHWKGVQGLKYLIIFGDSYSDVGASFMGRAIDSIPTPTPEEPLGYEFPGITWAESGQPNWVGHLITNHLPKNPNLLVYNYAVGGAVVSGVNRQRDLFDEHIGAKAKTCLPWNAENALFVTWVGINDCAYISMGQGSVGKSLEQLFSMQEELYQSGARNFLFINVPPVHRMPCAPPPTYYAEWNRQLTAHCVQFLSMHPDISVLELSAWETFTKLFDEPGSFGFHERDVGFRGGAMFVDHLHPRSSVHNVVAESIGKWLEGL